MKAFFPSRFQSKRGALRSQWLGMLILGLVGGGAPLVWGDGTTYIPPKTALSPALVTQLEAVPTTLQGQAGQIKGLADSLTQLTIQVNDVDKRLADMQKRPVQSPPSDTGELRDDIGKLKASLSDLDSRSQAVAAQVSTLNGSVGPIPGTLGQLKEAVQGVSASVNPLVGVPEQLQALKAQLKDEQDEVKALGNLKSGGIPAAFWWLLVINLMVGAGALAGVVVLLGQRKAAAEQIQKVVAGQVKGLTDKLDEQIKTKLDAAFREIQPKLDTAFQTIQPRLDKFLEQNQGLLGEVRTSFNKNEGFLKAMKTEQEERLQQILAQAKSMLNDVTADAEAGFKDFFQTVRSSWQKEMEVELNKSTTGWNAALDETQKGWKKKMDEQIIDIKGLWIQQLEVYQNQCQKKLDEFLEKQPETLQKRLDEAAAKTAEVVDGQLAALEAKTKDIMSGIAKQLAGAQTEVNQLTKHLEETFNPLKVKDNANTALFWPEFFQANKALGPWKVRIDDQLAAQNLVASKLFLALGTFNILTRNAGDSRELADSLYQVGVEAYRFWKSEGVAELDAALEWRTAFQAYLDGADIKLDIILALKDDRFDSTTMLSVDTGSATRMYVKEALSWIVRDKSADKPRVLCHAQVITC